MMPIVWAMVAAFVDQVLIGALGMFALFEADSSAPPSPHTYTLFDALTLILMPLLPLLKRHGWSDLNSATIWLNSAVWGLAVFVLALILTGVRKTDGKPTT